MKATGILTSLVLVVILQSAVTFGKRGNNRMLRRRCDNLCKSYARMIEIRMMSGDVPNNNTLSTILEQSIKRMSYPAGKYAKPFYESIEDVEKYISKGRDMQRMCRELKICKAVNTKDRKEKKEKREKKEKKEKVKMDRKKACKICKSVAVIVKASLDVVNNTFDNVEGVVKMACNMFMTRSQELKKCLSIVDRIGKINSKIFQKLEAVDICTIVGLCGNSTYGLSSCHEHLKGLSPWATAMSIMRDASTLLMSDEKSYGDIAKDLKQQELFSTIGKCVSDLEKTGESKRTRRSVETTPCPICEKIEKKLASSIEKSSSEYGNQMKEICDSLPSGASTVCYPISSLTKSLQDIGSAVLPGDVCRRIACPGGLASNRTCEVCQKVQGIASKQLALFSKVVEAVIDQMEEICGMVGSPAVEKECQKVGKVINNLSNHIISTLQKENFCKDFGLC